MGAIYIEIAGQGMKNKLLLAASVGVSLMGQVHAEQEPNDVRTPTQYYRCDGLVDNVTLHEMEKPDNANPLVVAQGVMGNLNFAADADWYYFDIAPPGTPAQTEYYFDFTCSASTGVYITPGAVDDGTYVGIGGNNGQPIWQVEYWYNDPAWGMVRQTNIPYIPSECQSPNRTGMNTQRPGRYFIRVWGGVIKPIQANRAFQVKDQTNGNVASRTCIDYLPAYKAPSAPYWLTLVHIPN